jgi:hypothetical protein
VGGNSIHQQIPQRTHARFALRRRHIDGCLRDKRAVRKFRLVQQTPKWLAANLPFADVLMPVELRSTRRLRRPLAALSSRHTALIPGADKNHSKFARLNGIYPWPRTPEDREN